MMLYYNQYYLENKCVLSSLRSHLYSQLFVIGVLSIGQFSFKKVLMLKHYDQHSTCDTSLHALKLSHVMRKWVLYNMQTE